MINTALQAQRYELDSEDPGEAIEFCYRQGWTDGLPVVPPTEERVRAFLEYSGYEPSSIIGAVPDRARVITAEKVAINAVMAGCLPAYMPVIITAVEALTDPAYNVHSCTVTTGGPAPLLLVNGPVRQELELNSGGNFFGVGYRANATIGRAVNLIIRNVLGSVPGSMDKATLAHAGRFSYCIAEDEETSPWPPFHVDQRGMPEDVSAVTLFAAKAPIQVFNESAGKPEEILDSFAATICDMGMLVGPDNNQFLMAVSPQHRQVFAQHGWGRRRMQEYLQEKAKASLDDFSRAGKEPRFASAMPGDGVFSLIADPNDIMIIAGGGSAGGFSALAPPWFSTGSRAVTKAIGVCIDCD